MSRSSGGIVGETRPGGEFSGKSGVQEWDGKVQTTSSDRLESHDLEIVAIGCGGSGVNAINRMFDEDFRAIRLVALHTDSYHLSEIEADQKILIGEEKLKGQGTGSVPQLGREAALESSDEIHGAIHGADIVFIVTGLGGGTGSGSAPVIADIAKQENALAVPIVTMPFTAEGEVRRTNAAWSLEELKDASDTVVIYPLDKMIDTVGNVPVKKAFESADKVLLDSVKGLIDVISKPGLIDLDFRDFQQVLTQGEVAIVEFGEFDSVDEVEHYLQEIKFPFTSFQEDENDRDFILEDLQLILQETRVMLLQQILASNSRALSVEELGYRNPDLSEENIRYHLRELGNRGIVNSLKIPKGERIQDLPNTFYAVSEKGVQLLKQANLFEEIEIWSELYNQMELTNRMKTIEAMEDRPSPSSDYDDKTRNYFPGRSRSTSGLVHITGGSGIKIAEAETIVEKIYDLMDPQGRIIWGMSTEDKLSDGIRLLIIFGGLDQTDVLKEGSATVLDSTPEF